MGKGDNARAMLIESGAQNTKKHKFLQKGTGKGGTAAQRDPKSKSGTSPSNSRNRHSTQPRKDGIGITKSSETGSKAGITTIQSSKNDSIDPAQRSNRGDSNALRQQLQDNGIGYVETKSSA